MKLLQIIDVEPCVRSAPLCIAAEVGSALVGAGSSIINGIGQLFGAKSANYKMRQHQTSERIASQQWQDQQRRAQNEFAETMYNRYESPQALVAQYEAAGLNPRLAAGEAGNVSASSGSSGPAPVGGSVPLMNPWQNGFTSGFVDIANALKSVAEAKKAGADTTLTENQIKESQIMQQILEVDADIKKKFGTAKAARELDLLVSTLANSQATKEEIEQRIRKLSAEADLTTEQFHTFYTDILLKWDSMRSQAAESDASAALMREQTDTESYKRESLASQAAESRQRVRLMSYEADLSDYKAEHFANSSEFRAAVANGIFTEAKNKGDLSDVQLNIMRKQYELLIQENHYYEARLFLQSILGLAMPAAVAFK